MNCSRSYAFFGGDLLFFFVPKTLRTMFSNVSTGLVEVFIDFLLLLVFDGRGMLLYIYLPFLLLV